MRIKVHRASSVEELRELCLSFEGLVQQCIHDINDLKSTEVDLRGQNLKLESAQEEHISRTKLLKDEVAQYKQKWQGALDLVEVLDQQLAKYGVNQADASGIKKDSRDLGGEITDVESYDENTTGNNEAALRTRLTQVQRDNCDLQQQLRDLEAQLLKAQSATRPPVYAQAEAKASSTYDLKSLRQELEDCIKQGLSPQLNVHIHHHEDNHIHNHEHQHYYVSTHTAQEPPQILITFDLGL